jgi:AbrB family looped-hinge helix DNA binding protein
MLTTTMSTKGQVVIPKAVRDVLHWPDGMTLSVEHSAQGVLLTPAKQHFPATRAGDARGCMHYKGPALSLEEIDKKTAQAFKAKWKKENS